MLLGCHPSISLRVYVLLISILYFGPTLVSPRPSSFPQEAAIPTFKGGDDNCIQPVARHGHGLNWWPRTTGHTNFDRKAMSGDRIREQVALCLLALVVSFSVWGMTEPVMRLFARNIINRHLDRSCTWHSSAGGQGGDGRTRGYPKESLSLHK